VGTAEARSSALARQNAEGEALRDLANECSFPPKGARIEDHYDEPAGAIHRAYAKLAIDFQTCEEAKQAITQEAIGRLGNLAMTEQLHRYEEQIKADEGSMLASSSDPAASHQTQVVVIRDPVQFFVVRQQIAWTKEQVILAPTAPVDNRILSAQLSQPTQAVNQYAQSNPSVKAGNSPTWTRVSRQIRQQSLNRPVSLNRGTANKNTVNQGKARQNRKRRRYQR
jgi:hypothetical protein